MKTTLSFFRSLSFHSNKSTPLLPPSLATSTRPLKKLTDTHILDYGNGIPKETVFKKHKKTMKNRCEHGRFLMARNEVFYEKNQ